jgi:GrpB-like predicted nucleotidyltransferase (UPF0157 family)
MRIIKLVAYNHKLPAEFEQEVTRIKNIPSNNLMKAYHIGSTAIPEIQSKPVIDILLEVLSPRELDKHTIKLDLISKNLQPTATRPRSWVQYRLRR